MIHRLTILVVSATIGVMVLSASARADLAQDVRAELQVAGVPSPEVSVVTPAPATSADLAALDADSSAPAPSVSNDNLISPDPTAPLPVLQVRYGRATATPFPGFVMPPGGTSWPSVEDADDPLWRLAIVTALKHSFASGATLAGVSMAPQFPNRNLDRAGDLWTTGPDPQDLPPTRLTPTMPIEAIRAELQSTFPVWAQLAEVDVQNAAAGERRVTVTIELSVLQFPLTDLPDLASRLLDNQVELNAQGAGIGSVVLRVNDAVDQKPLMTFAGDATWGQVFSWRAPQTAAFANQPNPGALSDPVADAEDAVEGAQEEPDPSGLIPPIPTGL